MTTSQKPLNLTSRIHNACLDIHLRGEYPSGARVLKELGSTRTMMNGVENAARHEAMILLDVPIPTQVFAQMPFKTQERMTEPGSEI